MIWTHASKKHPCPICKGTDWCTFGDKAMLCQRVQSDRPFKKGGWFHFYESKAPIAPPKPKPGSSPRLVNPLSIKVETCGDDLAAELGVSLDSLRLLGVGWSNFHKAWMFPMRNGDNEIIGWNRRYKDGTKKILTGTSAGLYIPQTDPYGTVFVCEGGTDTAALIDMGIFGLGRFNVNSGAEFIKRYFWVYNIHKAVIVADNDSIKQLGQRMGRPGIEGAQRLKKDLKVSSVIWVPPSPFKDVRQFYRAGGTREIIESQIKNRVWTKV